MVEFLVSNEIFIGMMALIIAPTVLYLNRIMTKLSSVADALKNIEVDYRSHLKDSEMQKEKLHQLDRETALNTALLKRHDDELASFKRSPV